MKSSCVATVSLFLAKGRLLCRRKLRPVVVSRKQMAVDISGHLNPGVTETMLHDLERKPETAVLPPVDTPGSVEVSERVHARVLGLAVLGHDASGDLRRLQPALHDIGQGLDPA